MGLDMYLTKKIYIGAEYEHRKITGRVELEQDCKPIKIDLNKITYIEEKAGYWRKANAIHKWFVENVQGGEDDCKDYEVSKEDMEKLLETVNKVIKASKLIKGKIQNGTTYENGEEKPIMEDGEYIKDPTVAKELLPTTGGFFFGNEDYNQWYYNDLVDTKKILEEALKDDDYNSFTYCSSW